MLEFCFKKAKELKTVINYYEDSITGTQAIIAFNTAVKTGLRTGKLRDVVFLPRYDQGKAAVAKARGSKSAEMRKTNARRSLV